MSDDTESTRRNFESFAELADPRIARENAYHRELGRFVSSFADVETMMQFVLRHYTKTSESIGRAVFSGARTDVIRGYLRRLFDVGEISAAEWEKLEPVLEQLRIINDRRNTILHYGETGIAEGKGVVSNAAMALTLDRITSFPISDEILEQLTYDCRKLAIHLVFNHTGPVLFQYDHEHIDEILRAAWRYIPPPPDRSRSRQDDANQAPKPPPRSSPP